MQYVGVLVALLSSLCQAEPSSKEAASSASVYKAISTPLESGRARSLLEGEPLKFASEQAYSKWSLLLENPVTIESVEIETCPDIKHFEDGVELYLDFDQKRFYADGGRSKVSFRFKKGLVARSFTFGFLESRGLCIQNLRMVSTEGLIQFNLANFVESEVQPSQDVARVNEMEFGNILDRELREVRSDERDEFWRFRIRSDGTFFARVFVDATAKSKNARVARAWSAYGRWTYKDSQLKTGAAKKKNSITLNLDGTRIAGPEALDSLPCGRSCYDNDKGRGPAGQEEHVVLQIEIQRDGRGLFFVRNRTNSRNSNLDFRDIRVRLHSLYN